MIITIVTDETGPKKNIDIETNGLPTFISGEHIVLGLKTKDRFYLLTEKDGTFILEKQETNQTPLEEG
ncbi:MAG: hypothetical protein KAV87_17535 [Desulfobacteraceae bacterium]|nr:hypothetical protein [Desulfobacteraceae bacterium]